MLMARKLGSLLLVVLLLLLVIPLGIGMGIGTCLECSMPGGRGLLETCALIAAVFLFTASIFVKRLQDLSEARPATDVAQPLEHPPRSI
jgi:hypothetical protein